MSIHKGQALDNQYYNVGKDRSCDTNKEREMPQVFKALATITAWVLFIFGLLTLVITYVFMNLAGAQTGFSQPPPIQPYLGLTIGVVGLVLSVVVMKLRKDLE